MLVVPLQGVVHGANPVRRAMPWAVMLLPHSGRKAKQRDIKRASEARWPGPTPYVQPIPSLARVGLVWHVRKPVKNASGGRFPANSACHLPLPPAAEALGPVGESSSPLHVIGTILFD